MKKIINVQNSLKAALLMSVCFGHYSVNAEEGEAARSEEVFTLDEIVVTVNKRQERLIDTAGSVNVLTGDAIDNIGAAGLEDYLKLTPGAVFQKRQPDASIVTIRGIGTATGAGINQVPTGSYIGDVPISDPTFVSAIIDPATYDLQSVEVLKGPQGVIYGSASLAGAVRYQFAEPDFNAGFSGRVGTELSFVEDGDVGYGGHAVLNLAEPDSKFGARFVGFYRKDGGYIDNIGTGTEDANEYDQLGARVVLKALPSDNLNLTATLHYQEGNSDDGFAVNLPLSDLSVTERVRPNTSEREFLFANFVAEWTFGAAVLTSSTGYSKKDNLTSIDVTAFGNVLLGQFGLPGIAAADRVTEDKSKAFSQEIRLSSNPDNDSNLSWVVGGFYQDFDKTIDGTAQEIGGGQFLFGESFEDGDSTEWALFADFDFKLSEKITIGAGGRYYDNELSGISTFNILGFPSGVPAMGADDGFAPRVSIKYSIDDQLNVYARYSKGFRFGGVNVISPNPMFPSPTQFSSDTLNAYEIGFKGSWDNGWAAELALYYYDWKDAQVNVVRPDFFIFTDNVGEAEVKGAEFILQYQNEDFAFLTSLSYADAETSIDFLDGTGTIVNVPEGTSLPGSPEFQSYTSLTYYFEAFGGDSSGYLTLSHSYISEYSADLQGVVPEDLGDYHTVDFSAGLDLSEGISLGIHGRNLTNSKGLAGANVVPGTTNDFFILKPRNFTIELTMGF